MEIAFVQSENKPSVSAQSAPKSALCSVRFRSSATLSVKMKVTRISNPTTISITINNLRNRPPKRSVASEQESTWDSEEHEEG